MLLQLRIVFNRNHGPVKNSPVKISTGKWLTSHNQAEAGKLQPVNTSSMEAL